MTQQDSGEAHIIRWRTPAREDPRALLHYRRVQAVLVLSTILSALSIIFASRDDGPVVLEPQMAVLARQTDPGIGEAWRTRALEREHEHITRKYLKLGYPVSPDLAQDIHEAALEFDIAPQIAFGLVRAESSFRNSATSRVGAVGLTQLMPRTAAWLEPGTTRRDLRDEETNLRIGFKYLRRLIDRYGGDTRLALLAYNRGPGTVDRVLERGGDPDNGYVTKVMGR